MARIGAGLTDAGGLELPAGGEGTPLDAATDGAEAHLDPGSDAGIVHDCLTGNPERFRELVERYTRMLAVFAFSKLGSREAADEVAQEAMVRAYEQLPSLRVPRAFSNWLMAIANNIILRMLNERSRSVPLGDAGDAPGERPGDAEARPRTSTAEEPGAELGREELWQRILSEVNELPPRYSMVVALKHQGGLSCREIAERLGLPVGTVTGRLSRAYTILRHRIGKEALE